MSEFFRKTDAGRRELRALREYMAEDRDPRLDQTADSPPWKR